MLSRSFYQECQLVPVCSQLLSYSEILKKSFVQPEIKNIKLSFIAIERRSALP